MEYIEIGRFLLSFLFVIFLILLVAWLAKRFGLEKRFSQKASSEARMEVLDRLMIDPRHRLVLIRRDKKEHLILLGANQDLLIESFDTEDEETTD